jgi:large subunit ribosomal protein L52
LRRRLIKQRNLAKKIVQGIDEIEYAEKRYLRLQEEEKNKRQEILDSKLKPKGAELLKK